MSLNEQPEPFAIDPNTIYPLGWLKLRLQGIVELPTLLDRTGLRAKRKFRDAILGRELLDALSQVEVYSDSKSNSAQILELKGRRPRGRDGAKTAKPMGNDAVRRLTSKPFEP